MSEQEIQAPETAVPEGLPEELAEGYKAFAQWRDAMARAGKPLPPGGVFLINKVTVVGDALTMLWAEIVTTLKCPPQVVNVDIDQDLGGLHHRVLVGVPELPPEQQTEQYKQVEALWEGWKAEFKKNLPPTGIGSRGVDKMIEAYISGVIGEADERFRKNLQDRLQGLEPRADLLPKEIVDILGVGTRTVGEEENKDHGNDDQETEAACGGGGGGTRSAGDRPDPSSTD